ALKEGLILPTTEVYKFYTAETQDIKATTESHISANYKFLHDRIQQAAYSLIPEAQKKETHLKIGQLLLENIPKSQQEERIFEIVNQLNYGTDLITEQKERDELVLLNFSAGKKAKFSTAYESAINYLSISRSLLPENSWKNQYSLTLELYIESAEAEYLNISFEQSLSLIELILKKVETPINIARAYELKLQIYIARMQLKQAVDLSLEILEILGITLVSEPPKDLMIETLYNLPEMTVPEKEAGMRILTNLSTVAVAFNPALFTQVVYTMLHLSIKFGNCSFSTIGYVYYGILLCNSLENIEEGYYYGKLSLKLLEKFNVNHLKVTVLENFNGHIRFWKEHLKFTLEPLKEGIQSGLESGNLEEVGYAACFYVLHDFFRGNRLELAINNLGKYIELMKQLNRKHAEVGLNLFKQFSFNLTTQKVKPFKLLGDSFNEDKILPILRRENNVMLLFMAYHIKSILAYLFEQPEIAIKNFKLAESFLESVAGMMFISIHNFYNSLSLIALLYKTDNESQQEY
ncbi:MAG: hypothetical protein WBA74_11175, partial [Cyclobacteriaceae bacterium]